MKLVNMLSKEGKQALCNFVLDREAAALSKRVRLARRKRHGKRNSPADMVLIT